MAITKARAVALLGIVPLQQPRIDRMLSAHVRKSITGLSTRWLMIDGSVVEFIDGKYRVVK